MRKLWISIVALAVLAGAGYGVYRYDTARVRAAQEDLENDTTAAARMVANNYATTAHLRLFTQCNQKLSFTARDGFRFGYLNDTKNPPFVPYDLRDTRAFIAAPTLRGFADAVAERTPDCLLAGVDVAALEPTPPINAENSIVGGLLAGPYRVTAVSIEPGKETDTVQVSVDARAGLFRRAIAAVAAASYRDRLTGQDEVTNAIERAWKPYVDEMLAGMGLPPSPPAPESTHAPDAPAKRKPVNPPTAKTDPTTILTNGFGLPEPVAAGKMTLSAWCKESGNAAHPWCKWWRGE